MYKFQKLLKNFSKKQMFIEDKLSLFNLSFKIIIKSLPV